MSLHFYVGLIAHTAHTKYIISTVAQDPALFFLVFIFL